MNNHYFTRQETMILTDTTSSRLAYLDRIGLIVPEKYGSPKKPTVVYSWRQLLQIRAIKYIEKFVPLVALKRTVHLLNTIELGDELASKPVIIADTEMYTCAPDFSDLPDVIETISKQAYFTGHPITITSPLTDLATDIVYIALKSSVIDFEQFRIKLNLNGVFIHPK